MNEEKLHELVGSVLHDLGGAFSVPLVQIGEKLGLYEAVESLGSCTATQLAAKTGMSERYLREWLCAQAASGFITYEEESDAFSMTPEQAFVFANRQSPFYLAPAFGAAAALAQNESIVRDAFRTGKGISWDDQTECLSCAVARFFRPGYQNHLVQSWLPSIDGMEAKLESGARIADVGCGHGYTTTLMAQAYPNSDFVGFDFHEASIEAAREHAKSHGVSNVKFEVSTAKEVAGNYDLVTIFDCLHDMGDPVGGLRHVLEMLGDGGACMIVEPMAGNSTTENLNPVSRLYYCASTMVCVPTSLAQETGMALGAQAGEEVLTKVIKESGFSKVGRVSETPFNIVLAAIA